MEGNLQSTVNDVEMIIDAAIWNAVAGLDIGGVHKFEESADGYSKMQTYRGMLLDPARSSNHAQVTGDDLQIVYGLKLGIQMNQVLLIKDIMPSTSGL